MLLIRTGWKGARCCALVVSMSVVASLAGCSDSETRSKLSSSASEARDSGGKTPADAQDASANDGSVSAEGTSKQDAGRPVPQPTAAGDGGAELVRAEPWRIEALGDSITEGTCTAQLLWENLRQAGATDIDMVGTHRSDQDCGVADADRDNEGHSGYLATEMVDEGPHAPELTAWCNVDKSDVVLLHLGTNDLWHKDLDPQTILSAFAKIVGALREVQPKVVVFVAQIIPMNPSDCSDCGARVPAFNKQIPAWAERESREDSPVYVVDQFTGFDTATDTGDGVHPNKQGSKKMADKWSAALLKRLEL